MRTRAGPLRAWLHFAWLSGKNMNKDPGLRTAWKCHARTRFTDDMVRYLASDCSAPLEAYGEHQLRVQAAAGAPPAPDPESAHGGHVAAHAPPGPGPATVDSQESGPAAMDAAVDAPGFSIQESMFQADVFHEQLDIRIAFGTTNSVSPFVLKGVKVGAGASAAARASCARIRNHDHDHGRCRVDASVVAHPWS